MDHRSTSESSGSFLKNASKYQVSIEVQSLKSSSLSHVTISLPKYKKSSQVSVENGIWPLKFELSTLLHLQKYSTLKYKSKMCDLVIHDHSIDIDLSLGDQNILVQQHNFEALILVKTNRVQTYSPSDEDNLVRSHTLDEQFIYACNQNLSPVDLRK